MTRTKRAQVRCILLHWIPVKDLTFLIERFQVRPYMLRLLRRTPDVWHTQKHPGVVYYMLQHHPDTVITYLEQMFDAMLKHFKPHIPYYFLVIALPNIHLSSTRVRPSQAQRTKTMKDLLTILTRPQFYVRFHFTGCAKGKRLLPWFKNLTFFQEPFTTVAKNWVSMFTHDWTQYI